MAGANFGVGSSRPVAALFRALGVAALIADEFNSLFLRNAVNAGLPALTVPDARAAFRDGDQGAIEVRSGRCRILTTGTELAGRPLPGLVLDILAAGGLMARLAAEGYLPAGPAA